MPTIHDQLIAKCEEARDTYPEGHAQWVKIESQIEALRERVKMLSKSKPIS